MKLSRDDAYRLAVRALADVGELIASRGWVRGAFCTEEGYCIVGAFIALKIEVEVQEVAFDFIRAECNSKVVSRWNDDVAKSKNDAVKLLNRATKRAKKQLVPVLRKARRERGSIYSRETLRG